jgi:putative ABC transport system ATP-binding protein
VLDLGGITLRRGEVWAITGGSGTGKTLFLETLGLLRAPQGDSQIGLIAADGGRTDASHLWARGVRNPELARLRGMVFGFVPQTGGLIPFLTAAENIALPQRVFGRADAARIARLIDRLGLGDVARLRPPALSIGQRQRVAIARALSHRPAFVIADEPTSALDPPTADEVMRLFLEQAAQEGAGVVLSSHDHARLTRPGLMRLSFTAVATGAGQVTSGAEVTAC